MHIKGFIPIIINVTPVTNLPLLLGLDGTGGSANNGDLSYYDLDPFVKELVG